MDAWVDLCVGGPCVKLFVSKIHHLLFISQEGHSSEIKASVLPRSRVFVYRGPNDKSHGGKLSENIYPQPLSPYPIQMVNPICLG